MPHALGSITAQTLEKKSLLATPYPSARHNSGREIMPQEMGINGLRQLGGMPRFFAHEGDPVTGDRLSDAVARKEPGLELIELPVTAEEWQQVGRQHDHTIAFALALADVDHHPSGVDVGALEVTEF